MATENTLPADNGAAADEELSLRETIEQAFEQEPTDDVRTPETGEPGSGRARDDKGRFAPKGDASPPALKEGLTPAAPTPGSSAPPAQPLQQTAQPPAVTSPAPGPGELKPPASWRPEVREKWAGVDPDVRAEIHRRESEMGKVLQNSAQARQFVDAFERLVQPYEMFIRAENSNPLQAVDNLMRTAAELRVGTPQSKAQLVAGIIKQYAIDLPMLDSLLAGQQPAQGAQQQQVFQDPRVDQLIAMQQRQMQMQEQALQQEARQTLAQFKESHEFYGDVAELMGDIVEMKTRRGEAIDLEKIYAQACQMHEGVSKIMAQRTAANAQRAGGPSQAVLRAKRAAASVKGEPTLDGATVPKDDSLRAAIEAAIEQGDRA